MVESRSMVNGASPGPAPADQARASSSRLTRSRASVAGRISPALLTRRWSSKAIWMRSGWSSGFIFWVLLVSGWISLSKTIIPKHRSTFLPLQHAATLIFSVDWGLAARHGPASAVHPARVASHNGVSRYWRHRASATGNVNRVGAYP